MTALRKILALLIIIFIGLPILFGIIWFTGLTKASVSAEFISDLPQEIIAEIPDIAEEIFQEAQDKNVMSDENTRAWFQAAAEAGITPKQFMAEIGLLHWLENELSQSLVEIGKVLRGERRANTITINLRPLKDILLQEKIDLQLLKILENLPPCDEEGYQNWRQIAEKGLGHQELPLCQPDIEIAKEALTMWRIEAIGEMEDEIEIFEDVRFLPFGISQTISTLSYILFIIPAFFIFLGALIAATSTASFFRWSGISILLGSLPALVISFFTKQITTWALNFVPYSYSASGSSELHDLILEKSSWIPIRIIDQLFSPVIHIAGIVCVIGVIVFVLSFAVRNSTQKKTRGRARLINSSSDT